MNRDAMKVRDVMVKKNGVGFIVQVGERSEGLSPYEAELLMTELFKRLPHVPERIALAWDVRHEPWIKLIGMYGIEGDEVVVNRWIAEVWFDETCSFRVKPRERRELALEEACSLYGRDLVVKEEVIYEPTRKVAEEKLVWKKAEEFCKANNMTMAELMKEAARL